MSALSQPQLLKPLGPPPRFPPTHPNEAEDGKLKRSVEHEGGTAHALWVCHRRAPQLHCKVLVYISAVQGTLPGSRQHVVGRACCCL